MAKKGPVQRKLALRGLTMAPSQVWGGVRIVPLLREQVRDDLRLAQRQYRNPFGMVKLDGGLYDPGAAYFSFIPHAMVLSWSADGTPAAAYGGRLFDAAHDFASEKKWGISLFSRMVKREEENRLRFLPLHVAMEGFLGLCFNGPDIAWSEYSRRVLSTGLSPRGEQVYFGRSISGLEDALRVFEIHEGQVGVALFVADALASVYVVPHPDDYRALHDSLLEDFYGELIYQYSHLPLPTARIETKIDTEQVASLADLRAGLRGMRREWAGHQELMTGQILTEQIDSSVVYRAGPFQMERFIGSLELEGDNHLGELIVRQDGTLEYLKTYRLSRAQVRRGYLLQQLSRNHWNLELTARSFHCNRDELVVRLNNAGFGYLLHEHVLKTAQKRLREGTASP